MKTLYEAANAAEAHMLADLLKQQGITADIHGEHLQGAVGGLQAIGLVRVVVNEQDFASARTVVENWEATETDQQPTVIHAPPKHKGVKGFVLGLLIGVVGMYGFYRTPYTVEGTDYNRDGQLDDKWTYALTGKPLKLEADRNLDRKIDLVAHYDLRGEVASSESDDDFNGSFETKTLHRNGNPASAETDTDGDGYPDLRTRYEHGVVKTNTFVKPTTGMPLRVEHIQLGKILFVDSDSDDDGQLDTRLTYTPLGEVATRQAIPK